MAFYTIVFTIVGLGAAYFGLLDITEWWYQQHLIEHYSAPEIPDNGLSFDN
ncbi:MAG: NhaB family Na+:H+ antiporter [Glaciecola sp.]|jgi:NhaB family Na+:H+ antiporter